MSDSASPVRQCDNAAAPHLEEVQGAQYPARVKHLDSSMEGQGQHALEQYHYLEEVHKLRSLTDYSNSRTCTHIYTRTYALPSNHLIKILASF